MVHFFIFAALVVDDPIGYLCLFFQTLKIYLTLPEGDSRPVYSEFKIQQVTK